MINMTQKQMLKRLQQDIKTKNAYWVAAEMGYFSPNTVKNWFVNGRIPKIAIKKVEKYLNGHR